MYTCEDYVVEKLISIEEDNDCLRFQLENAKRLTKIAEDKLHRAQLAISRYIKHNDDSGFVYIDSIYETYDRADFKAIIEALDIPMCESEVNKYEDNDNH